MSTNNFQIFNDIINGRRKFTKRELIDCTQFFEARAYEVVGPRGRNARIKRDVILQFLNEDGDFLHDIAKLQDIYSICIKSNVDAFKIFAVASFALFVIQKQLFCYVWNVKVCKDQRLKGLGKRLVNDIIDCVR
jgi:hypothetical protein